MIFNRQRIDIIRKLSYNNKNAFPKNKIFKMKILRGGGTQLETFRNETVQSYRECGVPYINLRQLI